ncbi:MAG: hypothetical protein MUE44_12440 [Oscillatoriaceae cyanobacterium Prado104]|jgi:hypothetical protein|nr:hypothetical protein [Oscillatoriaceae cyanobacterium Prado104]
MGNWEWEIGKVLFFNFVCCTILLEKVALADRGFHQQQAIHPLLLVNFKSRTYTKPLYLGRIYVGQSTSHLTAIIRL